MMETIGGPHDGTSIVARLSPSFGTAVNGTGLWGRPTEADCFVQSKLRTLPRKKRQKGGQRKDRA